MATSRIKGITIMLGADVTELTKALKSVDDTLNTTQNKLKDINKLLKMDPGNTDLLMQKQRSLNTEIETTKKRLETLKEAFKQQGDPRYIVGLEKQLESLKTKLEAAKKTYKSLEKELKNNPGDVGLAKKAKDAEDEYNRLRTAVQQTQAQINSTKPDAMDALQREIIATEQALKKATKEANQFGNVFAQKVKAASDKMIALGNKIQSVGKNITSLGTKMTFAITLPVVKIAKDSIQQASDYEENLNKLNVIYQQNTDAVLDWAKASTKAYGLSQNQALEMIALYGDLATSMGFTEDEALQMALALSGRAGDIASFKNKDVEEVMNALKSIFSGTVMPLTNLGFPTTIGNLTEYSEAEQEELINKELEEFGNKQFGFNKKWKDMTQREKVMTRYLYVLDKSSKAEGDYQRTAEGTANTIKTFNAELDNLRITIGEKLLPVITPVIKKLTDLIEKIGEMDPDELADIIDKVMMLATLGPVISVLGSAVTVIGGLVKGVGLLGKGISAITGFVSSPAVAGALGAIGAFFGSLPAAIIAAVVGVGLAVASIVKHWDVVVELWETFKEKLSELKKKISDWFKWFKTAFTSFWGSVWTNIKTWLRNAWNAVIQFFANIGPTFSNAWNRFIAWLASIGTAISNKFSEMKSNASQWVQNIIDTVLGFFADLPSKISQKLEDVKSAAQDKWSSIKSWFSNNPITASIGTAFNKVKNALGWYGKAINQPYTFNRPSVIGVGEKGSETVIGTKKLNQLLANRSTNNSVVVNVNANVASNVDINRLANTISSKIQQQVNMQVAAAR